MNVLVRLRVWHSPGSLIRICVAASLLVLAGEDCKAQIGAFKHLTAEAGLAQNTVLAITQDRAGFMWFGTPNGLSRYDGRVFKTYRHNPADQGSISSDYVRCAFYSKANQLWIGTENGLNRYDPILDRFSKPFQSGSLPGKLSNNSIRCLTEDQSGALWVGTANGLNRLHFQDGKVTISKFLVSKGAHSTIIFDVKADSVNNIWAATSEGLVRIRMRSAKYDIRMFKAGTGRQNISDSEVHAISVDHAGIWAGTAHGGLNYLSFQDYTVRIWRGAAPGSRHRFAAIEKIVADTSGKLWIGTAHGLFEQDRANPEQFKPHIRNVTDQRTLNDDAIWSAFCDRQGTLWFGTYFGGVNFLNPDVYPFRSLVIKNNPNPGVITRIQRDSRGKLWLHSNTYGVVSMNPVTEEIDDQGNGIGSSQAATAMYCDPSGKVWIGGKGNHFSRFNPKTRQLTSFRLPIGKTAHSDESFIYCFLEDRSGKLWMGTSWDGLFVADSETQVFKPFAEFTQEKVGSIVCLLEDQKGNIWVGTSKGVGLIRFGSAPAEWYPTTVSSHESSFKGAVNCLHEDHRGRIWVGTFYDGLKMYDAARRSLVSYATDVTTASNNITNLLSDKQGFLWMSNDLGLIRWHPERKIAQYYSMSDGLPGREIVIGSGHYDGDNTMYLGTNNGVFAFNPGAIPINEQSPSLAFSSLKLFNRNVNVGDQSGLLPKEINSVGEVTLKHDQSVITIDFAVLNFIRSEKNRYAYKLEGFDADWNYVSSPNATYTNLPAGTYILLAKGANHDGIWNQTPLKLRIHVLPPWFKTWWAYTCFTLFASGLVLVIFRFFWLREAFKKDHQLHQIKLDFFTNVSHEIRTHLSLIYGPVEKLLIETRGQPAVQQQLQYVRYNSQQLNSLVTELLDFRKAESNQMPLHVTANDLVPFLTSIFESFQGAFCEKGVKLLFTIQQEHMELWYDPEQLAKVFHNLLINAYKFTPSGGTVELILEEGAEDVKVKVFDNGRGIAREHLSKLFTNFFQVFDYKGQNTGYGIGLALSKRIVDLH